MSGCIHAIACSGLGRASAVPAAVHARREALAGPLVRGTLNVRPVVGLPAALAALGAPVWEQADALRWWPVNLWWLDVAHAAWVVRHVGSATRYLEVMSNVTFRALGVRDGDAVVLTLREV